MINANYFGNSLATWAVKKKPINLWQKPYRIPKRSSLMKSWVFNPWIATSTTTTCCKNTLQSLTLSMFAFRHKATLQPCCLSLPSFYILIIGEWNPQEATICVLLRALFGVMVVLACKGSGSRFCRAEFWDFFCCVFWRDHCLPQFVTFHYHLIIHNTCGCCTWVHRRILDVAFHTPSIEPRLPSAVPESCRRSRNQKSLAPYKWCTSQHHWSRKMW